MKELDHKEGRVPKNPCFWTVLLLLLSRVSRVRLCDPTAAHQAPRPWDSPGKNTGVGCHFLLQCMKVKSESEVAQSCSTLSDPVDCSLPGSSVHGILQARVLEWVAIAFSVELCYVCLIVSDSCDPIYCSLPGASVHGILQARLLEWLPFPSPCDLPDPGIEPGSPACRQTLYWLSYKGSPSNWGAGEESWESLGQQGDQTSQS